MRLCFKILSWISMGLLVCLVSGCVAGKRYVYEEIQMEYAETSSAALPGEAPGEAGVHHRPITLLEAVDIALKNNPESRIAEARIQQAEAEIREADAAFFPSVGGYTEYTSADAPSTYLFKAIDQRRLPADADFNNPGRIENFESGLQARLNLFNAGRDLLRRRMAEAGSSISKLDRDAVRNALIASVIDAYHRVLIARAFIEISEESVSTVRKQLDLMRVRFEGGSVLKSDVLSLEVRLASSQEAVVRSRSRHQVALSALAAILGVDPDPEIRITGEGMPASAVPGDYRSGLAYALAHRPELAQARTSVVRSRMALDAARSTLLPTMELNGRYYFDDEEMAYDLDRENWVVQVMFHWDLFTGFSTRAAADRADAAVSESVARSRKTVLNVRREVKSAYLSLDEARARLLVAEKSAVMAEESLRLVREEYEGGSADITRYLEAELDRNRTWIRAAAALYDRETARAEVGRAIGYWAKEGQP